MRNMQRAVLALGLTSQVLFAACTQIPQRIEGATVASGGPRYAVDPTWPQPLPNNWILGQVAGIATAHDNTIWVFHRPASLTEDERGATLTPKRSKCCVAAPPVLQFDRHGKLLRAWGGKGAGYDWPANEHGI